IGAVSLVHGLAPSLNLGHGGLRRLPLAPVTGLPPRRWLIGAGAATAALVGSIVLAASPWRLSLAGSSVLPSLPFARSEPIVGRATVVAADMVQIGENKVRLAGIEVPDPRQRCTRPQPGRSSGRSWPCGEEAREALQRLVRGQQITCEAGGKDAGGTAHGRCRANDADLGEALVRAGLAFDDGGLMSSYRTVAEAAKAAKAGIWASLEPERPSAWRERIWADAKRKAPEGCPIKGRVKGGDRIYHLPGSTEYARIRVDKRRGERWFCTEAEAIAAGWRSGSPG
ncbi:MAG: thermonuclease family protein, partial [Hyphomicrobiaceae bacterium]